MPLFFLYQNFCGINVSASFFRYLLSMGASTEAENESGEKPADLIDPDYKDLAKLFEAGCV